MRIYSRLRLRWPEQDEDNDILGVDILQVLVLDWSLGTKESPLFREYRYGKQIGDILILFVPTSKYMSM